ncbi:hypothetical protein [Hoeflea prorocentri]|uniref:ABM domain-containing protein n=1 Tax=Hoeflea prorocentri TaxID=1922333 RepID=A0A9X3UK86_9HYPH|nr:hypothetical protein [Hoeflea prorocentri]MCY6382863.1 hypothetical protein [Hoeflea prorocentri]MDA5400663.1 hypothetical protein [Hoeflea prorocentri]
MFTRIITWNGSDSDAVRPNIEAKREQIMSVPGIVSCHVAWNEDGSGVTVAVYESEAAASASAAQIQAIWSDLGSLFTAPPETVTYSESIEMR